MNPQRTLSGEAGARGVRDLLVGKGRLALRETLQGMIGSDRNLRSCRLRRVHFKPGRKLRAYYDLTIEGGSQPVPAAVAWFSDGAPASALELAAAQEELRAAGVPTRLNRLWAIDQPFGMLVLAAPLDPAFKCLGRLSDPRQVPEALALCGLPSRNDAGRYMVRPVRYRPGQRHVLEYRSRRDPGIFVKLYKPGRAGHVADAATAFAEVLDAAGLSGVCAARPAAVLTDADTILYRRLSGTPLSHWLRAGDHPGRGHLQLIGRLLRTVHSSAPPPASRFRERDLDGEVSAVLGALEAMIGLAPELAAVAKGVVERARERLEVMEQEPKTVVHGDLKADHLLLGSEGIGVLDTDRSALADPALDIGKLLADLRWWSWVSAAPDSEAAEAEIFAGYGAAGPRLARAQLYAALLLVKMAARRISVASRDWAPDTARLLALAGRAVDEVKAA